MIKQMVTPLKMVAVREAVSIPFVPQFVAQDGTIARNDVMVFAAKDMFDELCLRRAPSAPR